jgi:hypothetical protein
MGAGFYPSVIRHLPKMGRTVVWSLWRTQHWRGGKLLYQDQHFVHNICTAEGLNKLLDVMFHAAAQITTWYLAPFETDTTPADGTTYAVPVFTECTAYDESTRQEFVETAAASKSLNNTSNLAVFTMNATKTLYGAMLVGGGSAAATKGDTAGGGTLYAAAKFSTSKDVEDNDIFNIECILTAADDGV